MGEHIFRVLLSDIATVRVVCAKCGTAVETGLDHLKHVNLKCCACGHDFKKVTDLESGNKIDRLRALQNAIEAIGNVPELYTLEFPIRLPATQP